MQYFILIFIGLITLVIITSCGLISTTKGAPTKKQKELIEQYAGLYVFDKKLRDEIKQREKEREEYRKSYFEMIDKEKEKLLRTFFTEKEIQDYRDMIERDKRRRGVVISYSYHPVYKKANEILKELNKKYPYSLTDEKFPAILSNGYEYNLVAGYYKKQFEPYYQKIKEYMGDEVFHELKPDIILTSFYRDDKETKIPLTFLVEFTWTTTTYGLYGDEGAGFRLTDVGMQGMGGEIGRAHV